MCDLAMYSSGGWNLVLFFFAVNYKILIGGGEKTLARWGGAVLLTLLLFLFAFVEFLGCMAPTKSQVN